MLQDNSTFGQEDYEFGIKLLISSLRVIKGSMAAHIKIERFHKLIDLMWPP